MMHDIRTTQLLRKLLMCISFIMGITSIVIVSYAVSASMQSDYPASSNIKDKNGIEISYGEGKGWYPTHYPQLHLDRNKKGEIVYSKWGGKTYTAEDLKSGNVDVPMHKERTLLKKVTDYFSGNITPAGYNNAFKIEKGGISYIILFGIFFLLIVVSILMFMEQIFKYTFFPYSMLLLGLVINPLYNIGLYHSSTNMIVFSPSKCLVMALLIFIICIFAFFKIRKTIKR